MRGNDRLVESYSPRGCKRIGHNFATKQQPDSETNYFY